jgi:hypothetical protein
MLTVYYNNQLVINPKKREREREGAVALGGACGWWVWCTVFLFEVKI